MMMTIALTCEINIHLDDCYYDVEFNLSERRPLVVRYGLQQVQTTMHEPNAPDVGRKSKEGEIEHGSKGHSGIHGWVYINSAYLEG